MVFSAQSKLYFVAAGLFLVAVAIGLGDRGFELKTVLGLIMAGSMVTLGFKARRPVNDSRRP